MIRPPPPWVRIVLVDFHCGPLLTQCLAALAAQTLTDFEVVVVNNGQDPLPPLPDDRFSVLTPPLNLGYAAGCNWGAQGAQTSWLAMLNPDAIPEPHWLQRLYEATLRHPGTAMFGTTQLQADNPALLDGAGDCYSIYGLAWRGDYGRKAASVRHDVPVLCPCGAAALYDRRIFKGAGGFDSRFFCYLEDVDLGMRLRLQGHGAIQVAQARVRHHGSATTGRYSPFTLFHSARNGLWLMVRTLPAPLLLLALPLHLLAQIWLTLRRPALAVPRWQGIAAGLREWGHIAPERRLIQGSRRVSILQVAQLLAWHPGRVRNRRLLTVPAAPALPPPTP